jgi:hypothetical protein
LRSCQSAQRKDTTRITCTPFSISTGNLLRPLCFKKQRSETSRTSGGIPNKTGSAPFWTWSLTGTIRNPHQNAWEPYSPWAEPDFEVHHKTRNLHLLTGDFALSRFSQISELSPHWQNQCFRHTTPEPSGTWSWGDHTGSGENLGIPSLSLSISDVSSPGLLSLPANQTISSHVFSRKIWSHPHF